MKVPLSWLKEYVHIDLSVDDLARRMTLGGLEVEEIRFVGLPLPDENLRRESKISGFAWAADQIVVAAISEVMPHPDADRLVLCKLNDGQQDHIVLTGAPNLLPYRGSGPLEKSIMVAYAREGATIIDAYQPGYKTAVLKRKKIRGVESYSMACSERELGISDEHEGIILLDDDAPLGAPLADYLGDIVFDIAITPNIARAANVLGMAREVAAMLGTSFSPPERTLIAEGPSIDGKAAIEITDPQLNPRFTLGLIENTRIQPSPYKAQLRLRLAGVRPINAIVDATNYAMLEIGEPLHAFDYDVLQERAQAAGQEAPTIITRLAAPGEKLLTLDDVERQLDDFTVLVCDAGGPLALAGVMGGHDSEVRSHTVNVLLEGAAWNMINTRRTVISQNLPSEAAYRFSRGVHPQVAPQGIDRCLELMRQWGGGQVSQGLLDNYPLPPDDPLIEITPADVQRWLGISLSAEEIAAILHSLDFECRITDHGATISVQTPPHRLDIGTGVVGVADLMEEIARIYGYDRIPDTRMADALPLQRGNRQLEIEGALKDLLANLGVQEVITHRLTSPEREALRLPPGVGSNFGTYFELANPVSSDRRVLRQSLMTSMLEVVASNARVRQRLAFFEIGPIFKRVADSALPDEASRLVIALTGPRALPSWDAADSAPMDFFDLKGVVDQAFRGMHLVDLTYQPASHPSFHPGKSAEVLLGQQRLGFIGELHPQVREHYDFPDTPLLIGAFNMGAITNAVPPRFKVSAIPEHPPVLEDIALIVDDAIPAAQVAALIRQTGGKTLTGLRLFDIYRGEQIGAGKKSLAYSLTYQDPDRTLTDKDAAKLRNKIVKRLHREIGAQLRDKLVTD
ncbi:MAG: phenylalanine--tRNA ligase subunit beta [Anaerolineae bacterium]|nr:phenylalanine--tRNA ligase subunit beta [Anaerolineae bacterium]